MKRKDTIYCKDTRSLNYLTIASKLSLKNKTTLKITNRYLPNKLYIHRLK